MGVCKEEYLKGQTEMQKRSEEEMQKRSEEEMQNGSEEGMQNGSEEEMQNGGARDAKRGARDAQEAKQPYKCLIKSQKVYYIALPVCR